MCHLTFIIRRVFYAKIHCDCMMNKKMNTILMSNYFELRTFHHREVASKWWWIVSILVTWCFKIKREKCDDQGQFYHSSSFTIFFMSWYTQRRLARACFKEWGSHSIWIRLMSVLFLWLNDCDIHHKLTIKAHARVEVILIFIIFTYPSIALVIEDHFSELRCMLSCFISVHELSKNKM